MGRRKEPELHVRTSILAGELRKGRGGGEERTAIRTHVQRLVLLIFGKLLASTSASSSAEDPPPPMSSDLESPFVFFFTFASDDFEAFAE